MKYNAANRGEQAKHGEPEHTTYAKHELPSYVPLSVLCFVSNFEFALLYASRK